MVKNFIGIVEKAAKNKTNTSNRKMNTRGMINVKGLDLDADDDGSEVHGLALTRGTVRRDTQQKKKKKGCC